MSRIDERCAFCGHDPYEYVDIGVGFDRVAVTCCELACAVYDHRNDDDAEVSISIKELRDIAAEMARLRAFEDELLGLREGRTLLLPINRDHAGKMILAGEAFLKPQS